MINFKTEDARDAYLAWLDDPTDDSYNLWTSKRAQDFLFWQGNGALVPDGGATAMLLGLGFIGLVAGRKLMAKKVA